MKSIWKSLCGILVLGGLAASAQTAPKLALAEVSVTPTLAGKFAGQTANANPSSVNANVLGVWSGDIKDGGWTHWEVTISQSPNGALQALFFEERPVKQKNTFLSTSVVSAGNHIRMVDRKSTRLNS